MEDANIGEVVTEDFSLAVLFNMAWPLDSRHIHVAQENVQNVKGMPSVKDLLFLKLRDSILRILVHFFLSSVPLCVETLCWSTCSPQSHL